MLFTVLDGETVHGVEIANVEGVLVVKTDRTETLTGKAAESQETKRNLHLQIQSLRVQVIETKKRWKQLQ